MKIEIEYEVRACLNWSMAGAFCSKYEEDVTHSVNNPVAIPARADAVLISSKVITSSPLFTGKKVRDLTGWIYFDGVVMDKEAIASERGKGSILYQNMKCNGWDRVVKHRSGRFSPMYPQDRVFNLDGRKEIWISDLLDDAQLAEVIG